MLRHTCLTHWIVNTVSNNVLNGIRMVGVLLEKRYNSGQFSQMSATNLAVTTARLGALTSVLEAQVAAEVALLGDVGVEPGDSGQLNLPVCVETSDHEQHRNYTNTDGNAYPTSIQRAKQIVAQNIR